MTLSILLLLMLFMPKQTSKGFAPFFKHLKEEINKIK